MGVNEPGHESGNEGFCDGRDLPWLQDTDQDDVWGAWKVSYRDVIILDSTGEFAATYNLSNNDLGEEANYDALTDLLLSID